MPAGISRELVEQYFQAAVARDRARLALLLHDEVRWSVTGPVDLLPYCGEWRGKQRVIDTIVQVIPSALRMTGIKLHEVVIDGTYAATLSQLSAIHAGTGRVVSYRCAQFLRFRDDKLIDFHALIDSFDAAEQMLGRRLAVAPQPNTRNENVFAI